MNAVTQPTRNRAPRATISTEVAAPAAEARRGTKLARKAATVLLSTLKWTGMVLLASLVAALVVISLVWGPTPLYLSLPLAAVWLGLVALLVRGPARFGRWRTQLAAALSFCALGLLTVLVSQFSAYTPAIVDAQGKPLPGSIASLEKVSLNGSDQWISIRGKSTHNPVLLFLAGGPGGSQLTTARYALAGLEERFTVVQWDQPGSGKSFDAVDRATLTPERYIEDGHALVAYLLKRFGQEKVYLVGESWGSALGVWMAQRDPEQFYAFVGTGQMVSFLETDLSDYNFALNRAKQQGDAAKVRQLEGQGPPPYYGSNVAWTQTNYLLDGFAYMDSDPNINGGFNTPRDIFSPEYGLYDKVNWVRGPLDTLNIMYQQLWDRDLRKEAPRLEVPVYFLIGRHDVNAPPALAEDYYRMLQAPHKEFIWFEHAGHTPWTSEPAKFVDVLVNRVFTGARP
jgi:pimeloyl-ACP methyl ester carboxylesterase